MNADEFRDYIQGFIFYKYLSGRIEIFANAILKQDKIKFREINSKTKNEKAFLESCAPFPALKFFPFPGVNYYPDVPQ